MEKTEGSIKNGQSRGTYNIGHKTQIKDKQNKKTRQKNKKMSNMDPTQKTVGYRVASRGKAVPASYKTPTVLLISSSLVKVLSMIEERK